MMLSPRRGLILKIMVEEYVATAAPVASEVIARKYALGVSSATIRNDMARLEEEGYILRPHTSAGGVPADKAYRFYVESLLHQTELPEEERFTIRHLFHQVEKELEEWMRLASAILSRRLRTLAVVTLPQAKECRLKHLELVALQEFLVLLVLVLHQARIKRQLLTFEQAISQDELAAVANKLNSLYAGLTSSQIRSRDLKLYSVEGEVSGAVVRAMERENERQQAELYLDGLKHLLAQPEFTKSSKVLELLDLLEERSSLASIVGSLKEGEGVRVSIGGENKEQALQTCSLILSSYGIPQEAGGTIGIIGPTRMHYERAIPTVRYLSALMSEMVSELLG